MKASILPLFGMLLLVGLSFSTVASADCFELVYPVSYKLPTGQTIAIKNGEENKLTLQVWKQKGIEAKLEYPVQIQWEGEEPTTIISEKEMNSMKQQCAIVFEAPNSKSTPSTEELFAQYGLADMTEIEQVLASAGITEDKLEETLAAMVYIMQDVDLKGDSFEKSAKVNDYLQNKLNLTPTQIALATELSVSTVSKFKK